MEEPPPHVVFMMATTELHKIPDTILSRAQVYEFRTIGTRPIADQLRKIADAERRDGGRRGAGAGGARRRRQHARRAERLRSGAGVRQHEHRRRTGVDGARARRARLCCSTSPMWSRAKTRRAVFDVAGAHRRIGPGSEARLPRAGAAGARPDDPPGRSGSAPPIRNMPSKATAPGSTLAAAFSREDLLRAFDLIAKLETDLRRHAAALSPRNGAAALDSPAPARADRRADRRARAVRRARRQPRRSAAEAADGVGPSGGASARRRRPRRRRAAGNAREARQCPGVAVAPARVRRRRACGARPAPAERAASTPAHAGLLATDTSEAALARFARRSTPRSSGPSRRPSTRWCSRRRAASRSPSGR